MKFSILIANYNNGKFFHQCYNSIINQTYNNWEVIILDDCSTDNSLEIIQGIIKNDNRFKIYKNEENFGVGVTKKKLIDFASGDICGFVDPDDAITPDAIKNCIDEYIKSKNTVLTYSRFYRCDENLNPINISKTTKQVVNKDRFFFNLPIQIVHFVSFKKEVYARSIGMDESLKIAEDQDLYLKMYEQGNVIFIDKPNYYYRQHLGGISQNNNKAKSYEFWARVILNTMHRRGIKFINGKLVPMNFTSSEEIFSLLDFQQSIIYKIKNKLKLFLQ